MDLVKGFQSELRKACSEGMVTWLTKYNLCYTEGDGVVSRRFLYRKTAKIHL